LHDEAECFICKSGPDDASRNFNWKNCGLCKGEGREPYKHLQRPKLLSAAVPVTWCGLRIPPAGQVVAVPIVVVLEGTTCPTCQSTSGDFNTWADEAALWQMARNTAICVIAEEEKCRR
jgi:hypothetical protein